MNYQQFMDLPLLWTTGNFILMLIYIPKVLKWPCPTKDRNGVFIPVQNMTSSTHIHKCVWKYWDMQTSLCLRFFFYNSNLQKGQKIANIFVRLLVLRICGFLGTYLSIMKSQKDFSVTWKWIWKWHDGQVILTYDYHCRYWCTEQTREIENDFTLHFYCNKHNSRYTIYIR